MPYEVKPKGDYVLVRHFGETTVDEIDAARPEIIETVKLHSLCKVVVDLTEMTSELSSGDARDIMAKNAKLAPPRPSTALVGREDQIDHFALVSSLSAQHGMPFRTFTDMEAALAWLDE